MFLSYPRHVPVSAATLTPDYDLSWWTVDGGGTTLSTGEGYTLGGTAGQPDAGVLTGEGYTLAGADKMGYHASDEPGLRKILRDGL